MIIEKEYVLTGEDHINFQIVSQKMNSGSLGQTCGQWIIVSLPAFFILFSQGFIHDDAVRYMGLAVSQLFFLYLIFVNVFRRKMFIKYLKKFYYCDYTDESIKITITECSLTECRENSEQRISPEWVIHCEQNSDYIFLFNKLRYALILPTKYFSADEREEIIKWYGNRK